jgi:hypothetical protein
MHGRDVAACTIAKQTDPKRIEELKKKINNPVYLEAAIGVLPRRSRMTSELQRGIEWETRKKNLKRLYALSWKASRFLLTAIELGSDIMPHISTAYCDA